MPPPPKAEAPAAAKTAEAKSETAAPIPVAAPAPAPRGGLGAWLPVVASLLLAPVATWATVEYVLLPRLQKKITEMPVAENSADTPAAEAAHGKPAKDGKGGKEGKEVTGPSNYEFQNVVVNLAGTMGTRYLKTSFLVSGAKDVDIKAAFEAKKPQLTDVTLNVLSSLTLADLEEPGAKNVIREKLVGAYNQALGKKIADQVYFSDFVIQ